MKLDSAVFYSNDINRIVEFYRDNIGLTVEYQQGDKYASFIFAEGTRLGIKLHAEDREIPGAQTIFIGTDDLEALEAKFKDSGVNIIRGITDDSWGTHLTILDPDQNKVIFVRRK